MPDFSVDFRADHHWATETIKAKSAAAALAKARRMAARDTDDPWFEHYESKIEVNEIIIADEAGNELAAWYDEDALLRFAARDLLEAGRGVIASWEQGDLAGAVRALAAAVAKAEGLE